MAFKAIHLVVFLISACCISCKKPVQNKKSATQSAAAIEKDESAQATDGSVFLALALGNVRAVVVYDEQGSAHIYEIAVEEGKNNSDSFGLGELQSFVVFNGREIPLPAGYYISVSEVKPKLQDTKPLGRGSQGTAFLVQDAKGNLWALKFDNKTLTPREPEIKGHLTAAQVLAQVEGIPLHRQVRESLQADDVDVAERMKAGFKNPLEARIETTPQGIPVVIKTAIRGGTLKKAIESGGIFGDSEAAVAMREDLYELFFRMAMAKGREVYDDLNAANLMWDSETKKWVVIDAKPPRSVANFAQALAGNIHSFWEKMHVGTSRRVYEAVRTGAHAVSSGLYMPDFEAPMVGKNQAGETRVQVQEKFRKLKKLMGVIPKEPGDLKEPDLAEIEQRRQTIAKLLEDDNIDSKTEAELKSLNLTFQDWEQIYQVLEKRTASPQPLPTEPRAQPLKAPPGTQPFFKEFPSPTGPRVPLKAPPPVRHVW